MLPQDIDPNKLWLMEEGHCFRSQIMNLCELRHSTELTSHFECEAGSIETLRGMVELNDGITILPELTALDMSARQLQQIRHFKRPAPMREVSLVVHRNFVKKRSVEALQQEIILAVPETIRNNKNGHVVGFSRLPAPSDPARAGPSALPARGCTPRYYISPFQGLTKSSDSS